MWDDETSITAAEHTLVMQAVLDRPLNIIHYLTSPRGVAPTSQQVLDAAVQVRAFDPVVRSVLQRLRAFCPQFETLRAQLPGETLDAAESVVDGLRGKTLDEALTRLAAAREQNDALAPGIAVVEAILRDGASTIYSPDYPPAEYLQSVEFGLGTALTGIALADALGGIIGGGLGAGVASVSGAITAVVIEVLS